MTSPLAAVPAWPRVRGILGAILSVTVALGVAIGAALLIRSPASGLNAAVEGISSGASGILAQVGDLLPLGFTFAAGMVSAVNPCGFVLLPAYLGVFLGEGANGRAAGVVGRLQRGLLVGGILTVAFVSIFGIVGLLVGSVARALVGALPWLGLAVGVGLVIAGGYRVAGGSIHADLPGRLSDRLAGRRSESSIGWRSYFVYGLAYGVASLSCTLPIFLAVVGGSLASSGVLAALGRLVTYGLGMGAVVLAVTLVAALFKAAVLTRLRGAMRFVQPAGTAFLFVAGSYVVYYWLTVGGLLSASAEGRP